MKRGIMVMVITFIALILFIVLAVKNPAETTYMPVISIIGLIFLVALLYTTYRFILYLKFKTVEQIKKGVSTTTYGKKNDLCDLIRSKIFNTDIKTLQAAVNTFAGEKNMHKAAVNQAIKDAVPLIIEDALDDGILTDTEQACIDTFLAAYTLSVQDLSEKGQERLVRGALIRDLLEENIRPRIDISHIPYKAMKGEVPIWGYSDMSVAEVCNVSHFEGGSQGVSIRIAKGVYWKVGKVAAQRITYKETKDIGKGAVLITSHHLYYHVNNNAKRIRHDKIFTIARYADAVIVHMDGANAKPLILKTDDTWFLANILQNAQNWS